MSKPLFIETPDDIGRLDPFDGPPGFLLGPWGPPSKLDLAEQYFDAANQLVERIKRQECEDYRLVYPVLFLYRHCLELVLKASMNHKSSHHKLRNLADDYAQYVKKHYQQDVPRWIISRLKEMAAIDPGSMAFRYAEDRYNGNKACSPVDGDIYVEVCHLQKVMNALFGALNNAAKTMGATL
jgi:hypothetical protein